MAKRSKSSARWLNEPKTGGDPPRSGGCAGTTGGPGAFDMAAKVLKGGGDALIKVFRGAGFQELVQDARGRFAKVKLVKPAASRVRGPEMYLLAKDFRLV